MRWQLRRGVLAPPTRSKPGSPWWRAVNESLLRDCAEADQLFNGRPGDPPTTSVRHWITFLQRPSPQAWYRAHNASIVAGYLANRHLVAGEILLERFFMDVALLRVFYAHSLLARPRLALGRLRPARAASRGSAPQGRRPVPVGAERAARPVSARGDGYRGGAGQGELPRPDLRLRRHRAAHRIAVPVCGRRPGRTPGRRSLHRAISRSTPGPSSIGTPGSRGNPRSASRRSAPSSDRYRATMTESATRKSPPATTFGPKSSAATVSQMERVTSWPGNHGQQRATADDPTTVGRLVAVNVGLPQDVSWRGRTVHTGVWKYPVDGPQMVRTLNIDGDGQGDLGGHGGPHRAVLVYQLASYDHWRDRVGS